MKPGSASFPLPGIEPALVDAAGNELEGATEGQLIIKDSWPGQMRTVYGDHERFYETYFSQYPGNYISGHRMGTAEVESSLVAHPAVAEAAVVGYPHDIKGQGIYVYVSLIAGREPDEALRTELRNWVRKDIGPIATPDLIQWAPALPKTRSGKIWLSRAW